ncbi:Crp/Fnr family transcriptional regulator [Paracoccus sp. MC1862]|uniref:Crp/Fnr family transcriptional regulator n=1 Tax=Paracoccus sp. MC1862 TaxID=2760307 RepID=UPI001601046F|nr:Crp/Fnr family transcriptional regulator [Paracoccus sp. MC1862]MBB1499094.1 Crp/Fnr family transcriptional regulator [Paracoccus sp. MC1862]QQO46593.1 Crp/Fnr family transcriptional regulator [Paracoccus sp. MC1862]
MLLKDARVQGLRAGQVLFLQDEPSDALFVVLEGWIKLYRTAASGIEAVVGTMRDGQSFGEAAALCGQPWPVSAEAISPARLLRLDARHVRRLLQSDPALATSMLAPAFQRLQQLIAHIEVLKTCTSVQRVAEFLLDLIAECDGDGPVALPYNKALIAGRLGIKPETLSRTFARLRDHGVQVDATTVHIEDVVRLRDVMVEAVS